MCASGRGYDFHVAVALHAVVCLNLLSIVDEDIFRVFLLIIVESKKCVLVLYYLASGCFSSRSHLPTVILVSASTVVRHFSEKSPAAQVAEKESRAESKMVVLKWNIRILYLAHVQFPSTQLNGTEKTNLKNNDTKSGYKKGRRARKVRSINQSSHAAKAGIAATANLQINRRVRHAKCHPNKLSSGGLMLIPLLTKTVESRTRRTLRYSGQRQCLPAP